MGNTQQTPAAIASPAMGGSFLPLHPHLDLLSGLHVCRRLVLLQGHYNPGGDGTVPMHEALLVTETFPKVPDP